MLLDVDLLNRTLQGTPELHAPEQSFFGERTARLGPRRAVEGCEGIGHDLLEPGPPHFLHSWQPNANGKTRISTAKWIESTNNCDIVTVIITNRLHKFIKEISEKSQQLTELFGTCKL